jgi:hypothetical protein
LPPQLEELDVEGILAFAERVLPRAADLWVQASLDQRQRFETENEGLVTQIFTSWNPLSSWICRIQDFQRAA